MTAPDTKKKIAQVLTHYPELEHLDLILNCDFGAAGAQRLAGVPVNAGSWLTSISTTIGSRRTG